MSMSKILCTAAAMCLAATAWAQNQQPPKQPTTATPKPFRVQDQLKKQQDGAQPGLDASDPKLKPWIEYMTPGEHHKQMSALIGPWEGEMSMWEKPGEEPKKSKTSANLSMDMGGRYLTSRHRGEFEGMKFNGYGVWGYNNLRKQFESTWYDNMGTGIMFMTGQADASGKVFTFTGDMDDPMTGKIVKHREVTTIVDSASWKIEMFQPGPDGKEFKSMQIEFRRAGAGAPDDVKEAPSPAVKKAPAKEVPKAPSSPK